MEHYFIDKPHKESDFFDFSDNVLGFDLCFRSCDGIFSKNKIDEGTRTLLETIGKKIVLSGHGLDVGCGLGVISVALIKKFGVFMDMFDVNGTAVKLSKENLIKNNVQKSANVFVSNGFEKIESIYDFIVSNPPIKTGKKLLFSLIDESFEHLKDDGIMVLVIRKDHGMESLKNHILEVFGNCEIINRNKGYYILKTQKQIN